MRRRIAVLGVALVMLIGCTSTGVTPPVSQVGGPTGVSGASVGPSPTHPGPTATSPSGSTGAPVGCVNPPPDLAAIVSLEPYARLECFAGGSLTFAATVSKPIQDCGVGPRVSPSWFCLPGVFLSVPSTSSDGDFPLLPVYWNPSSGLRPASFPADQTLTFTGHFDDPAAATCRISSAPAGQSPEPTADVVLSCRQAFIVSAVR